MGPVDANQFTDLIRQHRGLIHKVACAYCQDADDREDVVQEIAVQLWRGIEIVFAIGVVAAASNLIARAVHLDTSAEVAAMQLAIGNMRRLEFQCFKWALLGGTVLWLPTALLLFEATFDVAALARVHLG